MKITAPGIYDNITLAAYHGSEICPTPSISSSGLRAILDCPAKYWWNSALNPARETVEKRSFSVGKAAHDWISLGDDEFFKTNMVLPEDHSNTTKAGKEIVAAYRAQGLNVISAKDFETIKAMRDALLRHEFAAASFKRGKFEPTLAWQDEETGIWLRARPDFLPDALQHIPDYKTATSAKPSEFSKAVFNYGYAQQAALYLDGIKAVTGTEPQSFYFVVQEKEPPYVISVIALEQAAIHWGRIMNRKAIHTFARCLETGHWPGYAEDVVEVGLPVWAEKDLERQNEKGAFDVEWKAA